MSDLDADLDKKKHTPGTFAIVSLHVLQGPRLTWSEVRVWISISSHASSQSDNCAWPTQELIAEKTGLHRSTVGRVIKRLVEVGHVGVIERKRRGGRWPSNLYRVLFPLKEPP